MENGGNGKVNSIFEARLPSGASIKPSNHADGPTRERFIRDKYERRKYFDAAGFTEYAEEASFQPQQHARAAPTPTVVGPPSDAAKQRMEQRRARMHKASSTVDYQASQDTSSKARRKVVAKSPVSAPPPSSVDLLDLMGGGGGEEAVPNAFQEQQPNQGNQLDLFDFLTVGNDWGENQAAGETAASQASLPVPPPPPPPQKQQAFGADILSLYNGVQHQPQQSFAHFGAMQQQQPNGMQSMKGGGMSNMMMNNGMNNGMQQMTNSMQNMHFQQPQMTQQQLYQQQQQMMFMQQQQQQQQQMMMINNSNMHGNMMQGGMTQQPNGFGAHLGNNGGPSGHVFQVSTSKKPVKAQEKEDPFAQFGSNVFRS